jgi:hypothetical protein
VSRRPFTSSTRTGLRRATAAAIAVGLGVLGVAATAAPASAVTGGNCNYLQEQFLNTYSVKIPAYTTGASDEPCYLAIQAKPPTVGVREVQRAWNVCYKPLNEPLIAEDGYFGANTQARVRRIQQAEGLYVDGVVGTNTKYTMLWPLLSAETGAYLGRCWSKWA